jgi:hypothetical protein
MIDIHSTISMPILIIKSTVRLVIGSFLKWSAVVILPVFKSPTVSFDKFDGIGNQLKRASLNTLICLPFLLIERANNSNAGALVKIFLCDFCKLSKARYFDPSSLLL